MTTTTTATTADIAILYTHSHTLEFNCIFSFLSFVCGSVELGDALNNSTKRMVNADWALFLVIRICTLSADVDWMDINFKSDYYYYRLFIWPDFSLATRCQFNSFAELNAEHVCRRYISIVRYIQVTVVFSLHFLPPHSLPNDIFNLA